MGAPVFIFSNERKAMKTEAATTLVESLSSRIKNINEMAKHHACQYAEKNDPVDRVAYQQEAAKARELDAVLTVVCKTLHALEAMISQPSTSTAL